MRFGIHPVMNLLRNTALVLLLSGSAGNARPQQAPTPADDPSAAAGALQLAPAGLTTAITATSEEREGVIHLDVAARDDNGRLFADADTKDRTNRDLTIKDLTLLKDGTSMKILSFHRSESMDEQERLNEVCLVLDEVDLSDVQFALVTNAVIDYLHRNGGVLTQPVSLLWIQRDGVYTSAFPSTDGNRLAQDIVSKRVFRTAWMFREESQPGVTLQLSVAPQPDNSSKPIVSLRDSLWAEVLRTVYAQAVKWREEPGRKALVWIGYGWSILGEFSKTSRPFQVEVELATRIREARMVIYEITPWQDPEIPDQDKTRESKYIPPPFDPGLPSPARRFALPLQAVESGGLVVDNSENLEGDIGRCVADARDFYTVSFDPPHSAQPDEYHALAVRMGTAQARTSYGYFNQPVFYDEPRQPEKRINAVELEQLLEGGRGERDRELAGKLKNMELTERLSTGQLGMWKGRLHGKETKAALTALGDESAFLAPPAAEVSDQPAPDDAMQGQMTLRIEQYLDEAVPLLPDFSADTTTVKYEQPLPGVNDTWKAAAGNRWLAPTVTEQATLLYRNGREQRVVEKKAGKRPGVRNDLNYKGIFGPILGFILEDVRKGNSRLTWARWERGDQGTLAVFRYSVRAENPRYGVVYCCLACGRVFTTLPEHHGELAIDPATGAVLRITVESAPGWIAETDLSPLRPVLFSNMRVEYGPVNIGGRTFICPLRSVVITRERTVVPVSFWQQNFSVYGPYQTLLNDTTYTNYHKFGSESRMLPGFEVVKSGTSP